MPLLDHFHPPLTPARNWESFHALWSASIVERLNQVVLPRNYFAETQVHVGGRVEVDVASFEHTQTQTAATQNNGGVAVATWSPPAAALEMPAIFPDEVEVQVFQTTGGTTLVGALELVSPGHKDRLEARRAFAAKCASYLQLGIGLVLVDVVTERHANMHDELIRLMEQADRYSFPEASDLYSVAYRPLRRESGGSVIEVWPAPLTLGHELPIMPLALRDGPTIPIDLEITYMEARSMGRL